MTVTRADAERLDLSDPIAEFRNQFAIADDGLIYLDGNSLGRLTNASAEAIERVVHDEWRTGLARSWQHWIDLAATTGDDLAPLLGAATGQVLIADQTSVNLFKLASAALDYTGPGVVLTEATNFPSDLYVLAEVARRANSELRIVDSGQLGRSIDANVKLISVSQVAYKSGELLDMVSINDAAAAVGAITLWDLSHSVGAVPIQLDSTGADLAVGCTYKYLNGGPGSPAFLYVREALQDQLIQPIHGWWGHEAMFALDPDYRPTEGIGRFAVGTVPIVQLASVAAAISVAKAAGIERIRAKSTALTELMIELYDDRLRDLGFALDTPRDAARRGGHVSFRHEHAWPITNALIARNVIPDFRAPDTVRLGLSPLYTSFSDAWDAVDILADIVSSDAWKDYTHIKARVT